MKGESVMRTWKINIQPTKDAVLCDYFAENTTAAKCMYNVANFYIRNTMTGIRKSPEERTAHETEVLHYVFTGIQKANAHIKVIPVTRDRGYVLLQRGAVLPRKEAAANFGCPWCYH